MLPMDDPSGVHVDLDKVEDHLAKRASNWRTICGVATSIIVVAVTFGMVWSSMATKDYAQTVAVKFDEPIIHISNDHEQRLRKTEDQLPRIETKIDNIIGDVAEIKLLLRHR